MSSSLFSIILAVWVAHVRVLFFFFSFCGNQLFQDDLQVHYKNNQHVY